MSDLRALRPVLPILIGGSVIVEQVTNGVHVRMAVLYRLLGAADLTEEASA